MPWMFLLMQVIVTQVLVLERLLETECFHARHAYWCLGNAGLENQLVSDVS